MLFYYYNFNHKETVTKYKNNMDRKISIPFSCSLVLSSLNNSSFYCPAYFHGINERPDRPSTCKGSWGWRMVIFINMNKPSGPSRPRGYCRVRAGSQVPQPLLWEKLDINWEKMLNFKEFNFTLVNIIFYIVYTKYTTNWRI